VRESLIDPDDTEELAEAEGKLHRVFKANLAEYCVTDGHDIYDERVFAITSIKALRLRVKNSDADLEGTGFPEFMAALNTFLTQERAISELRPARTLARQVSTHVREAVERRLPLLDRDVNELKEKINSVEPEFKNLTQIRDEFQKEIIGVRDRKSRAIADSFRTFVLNLENTFETDFLRYQPDLRFMDFFSQGKREAFETSLRQAFEQYINDKLSAWTLTAEQEMTSAFSHLSKSAANYGASYTRVTDKITEKLTGQKIPATVNNSNEDNSPGWAKWAMGLFSLTSGNLAGVAMAGAGFDWKNILLNLITVLSVSTILASITGIVLGPLYLALVGMGVGILQADGARKELVKAAKKELVKYLPQVAQEQWQPIHDAVKECFDVYDREVNDRMNDDINSRKAELDNLLAQKESRQINYQAELERLKKLDTDVAAQSQSIESVYQNFLASAGS
jgi:replication fork clamp-binding protein CrfC